MIVYATLNSGNKNNYVKTTMEDFMRYQELDFSETKSRRSKIINRIIRYGFIMITIGLIGFFLYITLPTIYIGRNKVALLTPHGWISGIKKELSKQRTVYSFKGIPYALPPIGKLRFQPPVPYSELSKPNYLYKAYEFGPPCVQLNQRSDVIGDEDCLYLNVFTPALHTDDLLPVLVWIHGGKFMTGSSANHDFSKFPEFVTSMNVVAVSMNYRLNAFGFLTLKELWDEGKSYGNYGIMDQILVLKWVQKNIKNFGGNPNSVTIIGQGSGGTSVLALMASPLADGLFHKAISMSGSARIDADYKLASNHNRIFLQNTKCHYISSKHVKECLLNLTTQEIMKAIPFYKFPNWGNRDSFDIPKTDLMHDSLIVIDPIVVVESMKDINMIKYPTKYKVPIILGSTAEEICYDPVYIFKNHSLNELQEFLASRLNAFSTSNVFKDILHTQYKRIIKNQVSTQSLYEIVASDIRLTCPTNDLFDVFLRSKKHIPYRYVVTNTPTSAVAFDGKILKCSFHGWDMIALFGFENVKFTPKETDLKFKYHIQETVKFFMMYGRIPHYGLHERIFKFTKYGILQRITQNYHHHQCKTLSQLSKHAWVN